MVYWSAEPRFVLWWFKRGVKEAIYVKLGQPPLDGRERLLHQPSASYNAILSPHHTLSHLKDSRLMVPYPNRAQSLHSSPVSQTNEAFSRNTAPSPVVLLKHVSIVTVQFLWVDFAHSIWIWLILFKHCVTSLRNMLCIYGLWVYFFNYFWTTGSFSWHDRM